MPSLKVDEHKRSMVQSSVDVHLFAIPYVNLYCQLCVITEKLVCMRAIPFDSLYRLIHLNFYDSLQ